MKILKPFLGVLICNLARAIILHFTYTLSLQKYHSMKLLFTCLFICTCSILAAQDNYAYADSKALQIPASQTYSAAGIASYINDNFKTGGEKVRAVYTWITNNVEYSKDSMYHFQRWGDDPEIKMTAILRRRKGVCDNYADLFASIVNKCGVKAVSITGYTKTNGFVNRSA